MTAPGALPEVGLSDAARKELMRRVNAVVKEFRVSDLAPLPAVRINTPSETRAFMAVEILAQRARVMELETALAQHEADVLALRAEVKTLRAERDRCAADSARFQRRVSRGGQ